MKSAKIANVRAGLPIFGDVTQAFTFSFDAQFGSSQTKLSSITQRCFKFNYSLTKSTSKYTIVLVSSVECELGLHKPQIKRLKTVHRPSSIYVVRQLCLRKNYITQDNVHDRLLHVKLLKLVL